MNEKKDKKSQKPEHVSKNWKSSQGIRLLAMVLAIVSGFFVAVTSVETVTLGMNSDWQGSQKDIEKYWIRSCLEAMRTGWGMRLPAFQKNRTKQMP